MARSAPYANPGLTPAPTGDEVEPFISLKQDSVPGTLRIGPVIAEHQAAGATSLRALAAGLNDRGIPMARGSGE